MKYFRFWIADFESKTTALSNAQRGAYLNLMNYCYANESGVPQERDAILRIARCYSAQEGRDVDLVLRQFFTLEQDGTYRNKRTEETLTEMRAYNAGQFERSARGVAARRGEPSPASKANGEAKPPKPSTRGARLPPDWQPDDAGVALAHELQVDAIEQIQVFRDYWIAQPGAKGVKLDWNATWRNWIRREQSSTTKGSARGSDPPWWTSEQTIEAKARELGMWPARGGESWTDLKGRIQARLKGG